LRCYYRPKVIGSDFTAYLIAAIAITTGVFEGHSSIANLVKWDFSSICVPVDKISNDSAQQMTAYVTGE